MKACLLLASLGMATTPLISPAQSLAGDYGIVLHVKASRLASECSDTHGVSVCSEVQLLTVVIEGNTYELRGGTRKIKGVIALGDYKARVMKEQQEPTREFMRSYEVLFPDGSKGLFGVAGQVE